MVNTLITTNTAPIHEKAEEALNIMDSDSAALELLNLLGDDVDHLMEIGIMNENCVVFFQSYAIELVKRKVVLTIDQQSFLANYLDAWYEFAMYERPATNSFYVIQETLGIES